ncbi:MAG TPA: O-succinylhomoserine sulfhydrylase [Algoriphagus sp.]|jgi:O-succinylhomoserine sulfhydrylase|uniref:trans-sulfuration enzyme family protein n=1 Tax=unclassified Algoriphagus TaxID=2641541 RepID=UPI000C43436D|nr:MULTISPECIES: PLP-dependent transferase [unclassified Algoriphagus]MAL12630.1 O-succinylhomoserine sulfhydrylase [Algoriphagus sp.]QYH37574.1 O-succinylhomoserine sulfhydrylase [Algoriphagus sp. NBT04N3]HAD52975.1 O-succinylhomoserine sulfhydrylase [Algoriphagus sp.]HAS57812.1 O-succinylhomoserine sulfhydrylase [Algoriphagus sp.]HCD89255.1 O-succinylhomoserine sulfhydrylase [Algoriphagus sp.]|tara:strand:- start:7754 stop:8929 length:1176 start_codon:yes stop_codon:yes gene_type:complete
MSQHFETNSIRINPSKSNQKEHSSPIYLTSSFTFDSAEEARATFADEIEGNIYSRYANPNSSDLIEKVCAAEGTEDGIATASGMAAMFGSIASLLQQGDHVLAARSLFGSTHQLLTRVFPKWGITSTYGDISDYLNWEKLVQPNTKMLFIETPSNPGLEIIDLEWAGNFAKAHNLILVVDNCFATPYLQQPAKWGAHIVTHSATKYIDGQGRVLGGLILGTQDLIKEVQFFTRHTGPAISPFNAWILSKSMETLGVRMDRHCSNALKVAKYFEGNSQLNAVKYPFLKSHPQYDLAVKQMSQGGGIITLDLKGGGERAQGFIDELKMISVTANLGDSRSIITHPASTTHSKLSEEERERVGISNGLIRLSVGLEHHEDIIADVERALDLSRK